MPFSVMVLQLRIRLALVAAELTMKRLIARMSSQMRIKSSLLRKRFPTERTLERFNSFMSHYVNVKTVSVIEELLAVLVRTMKNMVVLVDKFDMGFECGLGQKIFIAYIASNFFNDVF